MMAVSISRGLVKGFGMPIATPRPAAVVARPPASPLVRAPLIATPGFSTIMPIRVSAPVFVAPTAPTPVVPGSSPIVPMPQFLPGGSAPGGSVAEPDTPVTPAGGAVSAPKAGWLLPVAIGLGIFLFMRKG